MKPHVDLNRTHRDCCLYFGGGYFLLLGFLLIFHLVYRKKRQAKAKLGTYVN